MWNNASALRPNQGLPMVLIVMLSVMAGISVANIYYCQPLLNMIREDVGLTVFEVNLMPVFTQIGYALGLLLIVPMGDTVGLLGLCGVAGALTASNVGKYIPRYGVERINAVGIALILCSVLITLGQKLFK